MKRASAVKVPSILVKPRPGVDWYSIEFTRPLAEWYSYMSPAQIEALPLRVALALDNLKEFLGSRPERSQS